MATVDYRRDSATADDVRAHLARCDEDFAPPLSARVDLEDYAAKLATRATRFEAWEGPELVGLVAAYVAADTPDAFVTNVSVVRELRGQGVAASLVGDCAGYARAAGATALKLEVATADKAAGRFYEKLGFAPAGLGTSERRTTTLTLEL